MALILHSNPSPPPPAIHSFLRTNSPPPFLFHPPLISPASYPSPPGTPVNRYPGPLGTLYRTAKKTPREIYGRRAGGFACPTARVFSGLVVMRLGRGDRVKGRERCRCEMRWWSEEGDVGAIVRWESRRQAFLIVREWFYSYPSDTYRHPLPHHGIQSQSAYPHPHVSLQIKKKHQAGALPPPARRMKACISPRHRAGNALWMLPPGSLDIWAWSARR